MQKHVFTQMTPEQMTPEQKCQMWSVCGNSGWATIVHRFKKCMYISMFSMRYELAARNISVTPVYTVNLLYKL